LFESERESNFERPLKDDVGWLKLGYAICYYEKNKNPKMLQLHPRKKRFRLIAKLPQHGVHADIGELKQIKRVFTNSNRVVL
jgi:hypothetical protein